MIANAAAIVPMCWVYTCFAVIWLIGIIKCISPFWIKTADACVVIKIKGICLFLAGIHIPHYYFGIAFVAPGNKQVHHIGCIFFKIKIRQHQVFTGYFWIGFLWIYHQFFLTFCIYGIQAKVLLPCFSFGYIIFSLVKINRIYLIKSIIIYDCFYLGMHLCTAGQRGKKPVGFISLSMHPGFHFGIAGIFQHTVGITYGLTVKSIGLISFKILPVLCRYNLK